MPRSRSSGGEIAQIAPSEVSSSASDEATEVDVSPGLDPRSGGEPALSLRSLPPKYFMDIDVADEAVAGEGGPGAGLGAPASPRRSVLGEGGSVPAHAVNSRCSSSAPSPCLPAAERQPRGSTHGAGRTHAVQRAQRCRRAQ